MMRAAIAIRVAAHIIKVDVRNVVGRWLHWFRISSNDTAPLIAITGVGEQSEGDSFRGSKPRRGKVFAQCAAFAVRLIEAPEGCGSLQRLQTITHLKKQLIKVHLVQPNLLAHYARCSHSILYLGKNSDVEVGELDLALKHQMIGSARIGCCSPVFYTIFQTAIGILEEGREFAGGVVMGNRLASELKSRSVALLLTSCYR